MNLKKTQQPKTEAVLIEWQYRRANHELLLLTMLLGTVPHRPCHTTPCNQAQKKQTVTFKT